MTIVTKINHKGTLHGLNRDPCLPTISGRLQPAHEILEQQREQTRIRVALEAQSEIGLRAFWVEIDHNFLVHIQAGFRESIIFKPHSLR